jgi:sugar lactone lactonase YvrE
MSRSKRVRKLALFILLLTFASRSIAQSPTITTYVGTPLPVSGQPAITQSFDYPAVAVSDGAGGFYVSVPIQNRVYRVASSGILTLTAGTGGDGYSGDGGPAIQAQLKQPTGLALDSAGSLFIADTGNSVIRKVTLSGVISTVAGNGFSGDGGPAISAALDAPLSLAFDRSGNLYIAEVTNSRIRKVTPGGTISTVAGNGTLGFRGDGGPATSAQLYYPMSIALDDAGNLFIADLMNSRIRKVTTSGVITTVAGGGTAGLGDGGLATSARLNYPTGVAVDSDGTLFIADSVNSRIRKVTPAGVISTIAGDGTAGFRGDGGPANLSRLNIPLSIATDGTGGLFITDAGNSRVRKLTAGGQIVTVAGNGVSGLPGNGDYPLFVISDGSGGFYFSAPVQNKVYRVLVDGTISVVAGTGSNGYSGDGGAANQAQLYYPSGLGRDAAGNLYIADTLNSRIRRVSSNGTITTVAGNGTSGFSGDSGQATSARLSFPSGIVFDANGNLIFADTYNGRVRRVTPAGVISTIAGGGSVRADGGPATSAELQSPVGLAIDAGGNLFISDVTGGDGEAEYGADSRIRKVTPAGVISTVAGKNSTSLGDGGPATSAHFFAAVGLAIGGDGSLFIADSGNSRIRKITPDGLITTIAGGGTTAGLGDGGPATGATLHHPFGVATDTNGNVFIADTGNARIRKVTSSGVITSAAGDGSFAVPGNVDAFIKVMQLAFVGPDFDEWVGLMEAIPGISGDLLTLAHQVSRGGAGFKGDGDLAVLAQLDQPQGLAVDNAGNLYIADSNNERIRKVTPAGIITTVAGNGTPGFSGDGGLATTAQLSGPSAVAVDAAGNLYIADSSNNRIRKVTPAGVISTVAGNGSSCCLAPSGGLGGQATAAPIAYPVGIAVDGAGNLYIAGVFSPRILKVTPAGILSSAAGNGQFGFTGDGGPATAATLSSPSAVAVDRAGNLYIADSGNLRIRKVNAAGTISTIAGNGQFGFSGDGGSATSASITYAPAVAVDPSGNLFIIDQSSLRIRRVDAAGIITTVAGNGESGFGGDGGPATSALLNYPLGLAADASGNVYIADTGNSRVRKLTFGNQITYSLADRGAISLRSSGQFSPTVAGYASIEPAAGTTPPAGLAIFGFRQNGVLVTEAAVPAAPLIQSGRIYAEVNGPVNTGLAIANPNNQDAAISFFFTDANGNSFGTGSLAIPARGQIAKFLNEAPLNGGSSLSGSFTFTSSVPVSAIALRGFTNERSEFLLTTLPVSDLAAPAAAGTTVFPHFADGNGWTSQIILINSTDTAVSGTVQFIDGFGTPSVINVNGQTSSSFTYSIPARTSKKFQTSGLAPSTVSGSVRVLPAAGAAAPAGLTIFSYRNNGVTVTEASVPAQSAGNAFRIYIEASGTRGNAGSIQTGIAIANTSSSAATVNFELSKLDGSSTGLTGSISIPPQGQVANFLNEIPGFNNLPVPSRGVLRVASAAPIAVIGLRGHYNERMDFLITTAPPSNEAAPLPSALYFPQIADGDGYTTEFILFSSQPGQSPRGTLRFFSQSGGAWYGSVQ